MILVGVTGGMAAGKSTALCCFQALGASVVDADDLVHRLYLPGNAVYREVCERWGGAILNADGCVNRAAVAQRVFSDDRELQWLDRLLHPLIERQVRDLSAAAEAGVLCCAVPLLFEAGWDAWIAQTLAVWCDSDTQWVRLRQRGWTDDHIRARLVRQLSMDEKLSRAHYGIINTGSIETLRQQCRLVYNALAIEGNRSGTVGSEQARLARSSRQLRNEQRKQGHGKVLRDEC
jgi:dephospho-CoA kinase